MTINYLCTLNEVPDTRKTSRIRFEAMDTKGRSIGYVFSIWLSTSRLKTPDDCYGYRIELSPVRHPFIYTVKAQSARDGILYQAAQRPEHFGTYQEAYDYAVAKAKRSAKRYGTQFVTGWQKTTITPDSEEAKCLKVGVAYVASRTG